MPDKVHAQKMANEQVGWLGWVLEQREQVFNNTFIHSMKILNTEGIIRESRILVKRVRKHRHPCVVSHEGRLKVDKWPIEKMPTFLPARWGCFMMESSSIDDPPKLFPMSTNVGSESVVNALMRWSVEVGGLE
jgi:hypothetical protein